MCEEKVQVPYDFAEPATLVPTSSPPPYALVADPAYGGKAVEAGYVSADTAVVQQPQQVQVATYPFTDTPDVSGPVAFSCLVLLCCCCPLGVIALVFAIMAGTSQREQALEFVRISNCFNIAGVITGLVIIAMRMILLYTCDW